MSDKLNAQMVEGIEILDFIKLNDAQMATAIGLYEVAKIKF